MRRSLLLLLVMTSLAARMQGQHDKGRFFAYWGYNRAWYSWSDIHLKGTDYDFTLRHVTANDRPTDFSASTYFSPRTMWFPQYNYRLGWYFKDNWSVSLGLDHMKYVMQADQTVRMDGYVNESCSPQYATQEGSNDVKLTTDFLTYEHTDGLNLLCIDVDHYDALWSTSDGRFRLRVFEGLHAGPVIPRSDVRLFGEGINNRFNVAGVGVGAQLGLHFTFLRHLFIRNTLRGGWIDLPHVLTTGTTEDKASQHFWFVQNALVLGGQFGFGGGKAKTTPAQ